VTITDFVDDAIDKGKQFVTETVAEAANWTWDRTARAGEWVYRSADRLIVGGVLIIAGGVLAGYLLRAVLTAQRRWSTASHGGSSHVT
jgi:hypothetical protein